MHLQPGSFLGFPSAPLRHQFSSHVLYLRLSFFSVSLEGRLKALPIAPLTTLVLAVSRLLIYYKVWDIHAQVLGKAFLYTEPCISIKYVTWQSHVIHWHKWCWCKKIISGFDWSQLWWQSLCSDNGLGWLTPRLLFGRPCGMFCLRKVASKTGRCPLLEEKAQDCHNRQWIFCSVLLACNEYRVCVKALESLWRIPVTLWSQLREERAFRTIYSLDCSHNGMTHLNAFVHMKFRFFILKKQRQFSVASPTCQSTPPNPASGASVNNLNNLLKFQLARTELANKASLTSSRLINPDCSSFTFLHFNG